VEQNPEGGSERQEGKGAGDSVRLRGRRKALEGGPKSGSGMKQGRGGSGRMKAPRGCENLKAQAVGLHVRHIHAAAPCWEDAEGAETSREALLVGERHGPGVGLLGNQWLRAAARWLGSL